MASTTSNFKTIHGLIRTIIEAAPYSFEYLPLHLWANLEIGKLPTAETNYAFTIKFPEMGDSEFESEHWGSLAVQIEFVLDARKDLYLDQMANCVDSVQALYALTSAELIAKTDISKNFDNQDLDDKVLLVFRGIKLEVRSA